MTEDIFSIDLKKDGNQPLYVKLSLEIQALINNNVLLSNSKLPPIRKLAKQLGVNNVTVINAYKLLEQNGYISSKIGSGTYVNAVETKSQKSFAEDEGSFEYESEELKLMDQGQIRIGPNTINFASATPSPEIFPVSDFKDVLNEILERDKGFAFGYQESQGYYPLRESISEYLQLDGCNVIADDIQIISGAQQGIDILSKVLLNFGDNLIVESPTYTGAIAAFKSRGAQIIEVPILEDGIKLDILEDKIKKYRPKFIYLMPNFQNPTGYSYSLAKKRELLKLAYKYDTLIIEDDYLSELNYNPDKKSPSLKSMDINNKVIYIKSFSKIFMPGLRLAFLVVPKPIYSDVLMAKHTSDISTSGLVQRAFELYLKKGFWEKHISYMQSIFKERYDVMLASLQNNLNKEIRYAEPEGGLTFWLRFPENFSIYALYKECLNRDIVFVPGSIFYPIPKKSNCIRLSFAACDTGTISAGIKIVSKVFDNVLNDSQKSNSFSPLL